MLDYLNLYIAKEERDQIFGIIITFKNPLNKNYYIWGNCYYKGGNYYNKGSNYYHKCGNQYSDPY